MVRPDQLTAANIDKAANEYMGTIGFACGTPAVYESLKLAFKIGYLRAIRDNTTDEKKVPV